MDDHVAPQSPADSLSSCCGREIDAVDFDDGLPRGFLAGAIVEVWEALRLNWACELPLSRSGLLHEMVNRLVGVILK